ncbi:MAG: OmpH family outer membrane protein [Phycisphaerales bacterium JB063]
MKHLLRHPLVVLVAAALAIGALGSSWMKLSRLEAQGNAQAAPTAVAVLNLQDVLGQLDENNAFQAAQQAKNQQLQAELTRRQNALQQMQNDLELLDPDSDAYTEKEDQIFTTLIELRTWQQIQEQRNILEQRTHLASLYRKVVQAGTAMAEQRGIDAVLLDTQVPDLDRLNPEQLLNAIATRKVLYHNDEIDMTDDVIQQMNAAWANR